MVKCSPTGGGEVLVGGVLLGTRMLVGVEDILLDLDWTGLSEERMKSSSWW